MRVSSSSALNIGLFEIQWNCHVSKVQWLFTEEVDLEEEEEFEDEDEPVSAAQLLGHGPVQGEWTRVLSEFFWYIFLAHDHLIWRLKWAFLIACGQFVSASVCLLVCKLFTFSTSPPKPLSNFNQTWHKASFGEGNSNEIVPLGQF